MARPWIRLYTDLRHSAKIQRLPDHLFRFAINCWCLTGASKDDCLPPVDEIAFEMHIDPKICQAYIDHLIEQNVLTRRQGSGKIVPKIWDDRQFLSDSSTDRVRKYRERLQKSDMKRLRNVSVTAQDSDTDQIQTRPEADGALPRGMDFPAEMQTHLRTAGLANTPDDLLAKLSQRAQKYKRTPTHAASVFLEVYHKALKQPGVRDGTGYLLTAFESEMKKVVN